MANRQVRRCETGASLIYPSLWRGVPEVWGTNQERFGELTRALTTTFLSRWQVLKGLLAGAVAGTSSALFAAGNGAGSSAENYTELIERKGDHEGI